MRPYQACRRAIEQGRVGEPTGELAMHRHLGVGVTFAQDGAMVIARGSIRVPYVRVPLDPARPWLTMTVCDQVGNS
jgi:hypothetical protein